MLNVILILIQIATALIALALIVIRLIESINELRKKEDLSTIGKIWQVIKNFCTIETYK